MERRVSDFSPAAGRRSSKVDLEKDFGLQVFWAEAGLRFFT